jgi:hypothetical protein
VNWGRSSLCCPGACRLTLTVPYWRVEAVAAQTRAGSWRRPCAPDCAPDLELEAARSAARAWTTVDRGDRAFFVWREFICDILRAMRVTPPGEEVAFGASAPHSRNHVKRVSFGDRPENCRHSERS